MAVDALPARQEARERALVGRLDLLAQRGQRGAAQPPQHLGVAPLARACRPGRSSPRTSSPARSSPRQHRRQVEPVAVAQRARLERAVRARPAPHEPLHRVGHVGEERRRQPAGRHGAERVAVEPGVLGGDPALLAADAQHDRAALVAERVEPAGEVGARRDPRRSSSAVRSPTPAQHVVQRVGGVGARALATCAAGRPRPAPARPGRSGRAAPPARAARAAGRGRARARPRAARRSACRPRTCRSRRSRTAARRRTARRSASRPRRRSARARAACAAGRAGRARRARRAGTRGRSRARSGTGRSGCATSSSVCDFSRCCHSGVRRPG